MRNSTLTPVLLTDSEVIFYLGGNELKDTLKVPLFPVNASESQL